MFYISPRLDSIRGFTVLTHCADAANAEGHEKTLITIAHAMGGSRYLISAEVDMAGFALSCLLRLQQAFNKTQVVRVGAHQVHGFPSEAALPRHLHDNHL